MEIATAIEEKRREIIYLLKKENLPFEDLPSDLSGFYTAIHDDQLIGVIGMEPYGNNGLLRSMVVDSSFRNRHIAEQLVNTLEENAKTREMKTIYLLTETAEQYFSRKGYVRIKRQDVPVELFRSSEFSHVCPVSATVMKKSLIY
jgi:amino-acid N-acetyltransferase